MLAIGEDKRNGFWGSPKMKKGELVAAAERHLAQSRWLPEI
jgi:hypothetical protein